MFSKQEQRSWIKLECARGRTARQCHQGLQEACGESALPYRTVARWVKAFNEGRQNVADMRRPGRPSVREEVYALSALLESDRRHTIRELARETGLAHTTVLHILKERLGMRKIASRWVPHDLTEMQKWLRYDAAPVADLFDRWGWEVLYHPPYSPDLSPCDFDLIPKMKEPLHGIHFRTVPEILQAVDRSIRTTNTTGAAKGILRLPHCWQWVVHNAGDYIEGQ
ncbi:hypothetical protein B7P43_G00887 [Cryptotermes secundus]|uniref:Mos1 transposase HTH domain-containing protein n=1 Tax=Cryptotermes secundus TaxID=105785 RepID=A0A2J7PKA2_9NEOP|nr:hypothetical protein B7P43_G00887 [Cryptotermes secundus]